MLFRTKAILLASLLLVAPAIQGPGPPGIVVIATTAIRDQANAALDLRDLEHYLVQCLIDRRVEKVVAASSVARQITHSADSYLLELSIDEAERAARPRWQWTEHRFRDDAILHLELSVTVTRLKDSAIVGGLYDTRDFRAEDYGDFSRPEAVRGATYEAAADLMDDFVLAASTGYFGPGLTSIKRPEAPPDLLHNWGKLPPDWKVFSVFAVVFVFIVALGIAVRLAYALARLIFWVLVPPGLRRKPVVPLAEEEDYVPPRLPKPRRRRPPPEIELDPPEDEEEEPDEVEQAEAEEEDSRE